MDEENVGLLAEENAAASASANTDANRPVVLELPNQRKNKRKVRPVLILSSLLLAVILGVSLIYFHKPAPPKRNVIMMVSDGFGPASETFARQYNTYINNLPYDTLLPLDTILVGTSRTRSNSSLVTDSAAGATAFSCGMKSYNGAISVDPEGKPCGTVLEAAKEDGYMTALVVTSKITDATPACFASHVTYRWQEDTIALHEIGMYPLGRRVDLMFGGGRCQFLPNTTAGSCRKDDIDVVAESAKLGWTSFFDRESFDALNEDNAKLPLYGLFAPHHMNYDIDRDPAQQPSLREMAQKALEILKKATEDSSKGFFILIEGSRIDMAAHSNDPAGHVHDILAYQEVITYVKSFVESNPGTVMISVADHETGGFSVARQVNDAYPQYLWNPQALVGVQNSSEILGAAVAEYSGPDLEGFVRNTVLKSWLNVTDATTEEVQSVLDKASDPWAADYALSKIVSIRAQLGWATHGHSAVDVNLYSYGENSSALAGNHENTDIGKFIRDNLGLDLDSITKRLRASPLLQTQLQAGPSPAEVASGSKLVAGSAADAAHRVGIKQTKNDN